MTWADVPGHEGYYQVSDDGRVRSIERTIHVNPRNKSAFSYTLPGKELVPSMSTKYRAVSLWKNHKLRTAKISVLVLEAFVGLRPEGMHACHIDGNCVNDTLKNLYWGTPTQNSEDKRRHGTHLHGDLCPQAKLTRHDVREIRNLRGKMSQSAIGRKFGVSQTSVSKILLNKQHNQYGEGAA